MRPKKFIMKNTLKRIGQDGKNGKKNILVNIERVFIVQ